MTVLLDGKGMKLDLPSAYAKLGTIPGIRTPGQAAENAGALLAGPLAAAAMAQIAALLAAGQEPRA